jgi:hypothetical protein
MALLNKAQAGIYLSIQSGKIAHRVTEATSTSKSRTLDTGKVIHEELYDSLEGKITGISFKDGDYGQQLLIQVEADGQRATLQMPLSSSPASGFLKALPNINPEQLVKFSPKMQEVDGKRKTSLVLSQAGKGVKWFWTKDTPGDLPPMKKIKVKGKETWDDSEQIEYLMAYVKEKFLPKLASDQPEKSEGWDTFNASEQDAAPF